MYVTGEILANFISFKQLHEP